MEAWLHGLNDHTPVPRQASDPQQIGSIGGYSGAQARQLYHLVFVRLVHRQKTLIERSEHRSSKRKGVGTLALHLPAAWC